MEPFVFEIANYLLRRDEESLMKEVHRERRKQERSQILTHHLFDRLSPIEAVQEMLNMDRAFEDRYVIPIRYPESDRPDWVDLVEFTMPHDVHLNTQVLGQEILECYRQRDHDNEDRLTAIESAFATVAAKHGGAWKYLEQSEQPLEVE